MKRRTGEIQIFSTSFLDLLSCGLGGVLLLFLYSFTQSQQKAVAYERQAASMQQQLDKAQSEVRQAQHAVQEARKDVTELENARRTLERAQSTLVGLKGDLKGVVFVFDTSGSMATPRFPEYLGLIKNWVQQLNFERFNVVRFSSDVQAWQNSGLVDASPANRQAASRFIDEFKPNGNTNTLGALQKALSFAGVDTIVLFSDGKPEPDQTADDVLRWLRSNNRGAAINTVAMGNYFKAEYGYFLQQMAHEHGGMFIGR